MSKKYSILTLDISGFNPDILTSLLFREGCKGIEEESDQCWRIYFSDRLSGDKLDGLFTTMQKFNPSFNSRDMKISEEEEKEWLKEWKKNFHPLKVGKQVWISPPWERADMRKGEIQVIIDPRMAFGTGHHATTQLMIGAMPGHLKASDSVLDAGCGSGILSILAWKMGAKKVTGFDIDPEAIDNSRHNSRLNNCAGIDFIPGNLSGIPEDSYDILLANINRTVLLELLPEFNPYLKTGGTLILSGLLQEEQANFLSVLPAWLTLQQQLHKKEWAALVLKK